MSSQLRRILGAVLGLAGLATGVCYAQECPCVPPNCSVAADCQSADCVVVRRSFPAPITYCLNIGQCTELFRSFNDEGECVSWKIQDDKAAVRITRTNLAPNQRPMFVYSEVDQPFIGGTDQYCDEDIYVECVPRDPHGAWPAPPLFVPIDAGSVDPVVRAEKRAHYRRLDASGPARPILALERAFFWENSETQVCCSFSGGGGPFGEINVSIVSPRVVKNYLEGQPGFAYQDLVDNPDIWRASRRLGLNVPGPIFNALSDCAPCSLFLDEPHNEWVDGPWGAVYSNMGLVDWVADKRSVGEADEVVDGTWLFDSCDDPQDPACACPPGRGPCVGLVFSEADDSNPEDFLGATLWSRDDTEDTVLLRMFGWVKLKNVKDGPEAPVDSAQVFVWDDWHTVSGGQYPIELYRYLFAGPGCSEPTLQCIACPPQQSCAAATQCDVLACTPGSRANLQCPSTNQCGTSPVIDPGRFTTIGANGRPIINEDGFPVAVCETYRCGEQETMPVGTPYRPFDSWDAAYAAAAPGATMGLFSGHYPSGRTLCKPMTLSRVGKPGDEPAVFDKAAGVDPSGCPPSTSMNPPAAKASHRSHRAKRRESRGPK